MDTSKHWCENDEFWDLFGTWMFTESRWNNAPAEVDHILALTGVTPPAAVLDICCGPGRHSLELSRRGFTVTGVDRTIAYLDDARKRAASEQLDIEYIVDDMRHFRRENAVDLILSMFTAFGYFEDDDEERAVLDNMYASLKPGGKVIFDMFSKEILARIFIPKSWEEQDGVYMLEERTPSPDWKFMHNRWVLIKDGIVHEHEFNLRIYSVYEFEMVLEAAGFSQIDIYGSLKGTPHDHHAQRLVVVATK